jgi:hypothetical protein
MILQTARAYAADLRRSPSAVRLAGPLAVASTAALLLSGFLLWADTGRSAGALLVAVAVGGLALVGHTVSVLLRTETRGSGGNPLAAE